jgi:hypothetical protein
MSRANARKPEVIRSRIGQLVEVRSREVLRYSPFLAMIKSQGIVKTVAALRNGVMGGGDGS